MFQPVPVVPPDSHRFVCDDLFLEVALARLGIESAADFRFSPNLFF